MALAGIIKTMRPKQWVKNLFVLAPVVFAKNLFHEPILLRAAAAFAGFSVLAGAVYTINDLADADDDRRHPTKRYRPIASGEVPPGVAKVAAVVMVVSALGGTLWLDWRVGVTALAYLVLNLAYSFKLKQIAYLDVGCIALGFVFRVVAGCYAVSTPSQPIRPSLLLLLCTAFLSLFLGFGKRYHELSVNAAKARDALRFYSLPMLRGALWVTALATVGVYLAWTLDPPEIFRFARDYLWVTTPFVLFGIGRFVRLLGSKHGESPTDAMLKDVPFVLTIITWGILVVSILYRLRPT
ncbi:MAG: UbiA prenyltransferase family protein [Myxococcales bacterium]|nr:UbiA prenyltransferase family protein [Myxococcales bacterium]